MARTLATFDFRGLARQEARLAQFSSDRLATVAKRAISTLTRRLPVRAATLAAEQIVNLPRTHVRKALNATAGGPAGERYVSLTGSRQRVPLHLFGGARYGGRKTPGAVAKPYRSAETRLYKSSFAIKGRGIRGGIWSRLPASAVNRDRFPRLIILRKGPSIARAIAEGTHGNIMPELAEFGGEVLRNEVNRLMKVVR